MVGPALLGCASCNDAGHVEKHLFGFSDGFAGKELPVLDQELEVGLLLFFRPFSYGGSRGGLCEHRIILFRLDKF
jgi:hypothetical protein